MDESKGFSSTCLGIDCLQRAYLSPPRFFLGTFSTVASEVSALVAGCRFIVMLGTRDFTPLVRLCLCFLYTSQGMTWPLAGLVVPCATARLCCGYSHRGETPVQKGCYLPAGSRVQGSSCLELPAAHGSQIREEGTLRNASLSWDLTLTSISQEGHCPHCSVPWSPVPGSGVAGQSSLLPDGPL